MPLQFAFIAFLTVIIDQLFKWHIRHSLALGETQNIIANWLHWTHSQNSGAAWGMLSGQRWPLILVSLGVAFVIVKTARDMARETANGVLPLAALGLVFGGAIGNLIDRIFAGVVTDMIDLDTPVHFLRTFPIFNLADCALTIGVALLLLHFLLRRNLETGTLNPEL